MLHSELKWRVFDDVYIIYLNKGEMNELYTATYAMGWIDVTINVVVEDKTTNREIDPMIWSHGLMREI